VAGRIRKIINYNTTFLNFVNLIDIQNFSDQFPPSFPRLAAFSVCEMQCCRLHVALGQIEAAAVFPDIWKTGCTGTKMAPG
jgi:hypothetical protein